MSEMVQAAFDNLASPAPLFFLFGIVAARTRSGVNLPSAIGQALALYLMMAIGLKGGWQLRNSGLSLHLVTHIVAAICLGMGLAFLSYTLLRLMTKLSSVDVAALAAHYGSVSVVTFVAASEFLKNQGIWFEGHMVGLMAVMEAPAIIAAVWLARRGTSGTGPGHSVAHALTNASVMVLVGCLLLGFVSGETGRNAMSPVFVAPFLAILAIFLLDIGIKAGKRLEDLPRAGWRLLAFAVVMPVLGGTIGAAVGTAIGLSVGGTTLLAVLSASASYIAAPAAVRMALPQANVSLYGTLPLGITFPFNITVGIPLYYGLARLFASVVA